MEDAASADPASLGPDRMRWWAAGACALAGFLLFQFLGNSGLGYINTHSLFYWWGYQWVNPDSETEHGVLILGISAWLLWRNLGRDARDGGGFGRAAVTAMAGGVLLHVVGFVASQARVSILGLLLFAWGVLGLGGGRRWARAAAFPLAFMVFAIPVSALDSAGFWLRMGVVRASTAVSHAIGIAVVVNGTQMLSPDGRYNYDVAAACSGVRSLVALCALSVLIGYIRFRRPGPCIALLALCVPLIALGNIVRIVAIVVGARLGGQAWGDRVHEVMGYGVFAIVLGGVYLAGGLIERFARGADAEDEPPIGPAAGSPRQYAWAGAAGVGAAAAAAAVLVHVSGLPPRGSAGIRLAAGGTEPAELPTFLAGDWIGRRSEVTDVERQILPPDTGYSRKVYVPLDDPSKQVFLSIVLSGRDRTSIHRPELCLIGQGWTIKGSYEHRFTYPGTGKSFPATILQVEKETLSPAGRVRAPQLVAYYFVGGDRIVSSHWERLLADAWNRVVHGRADRWAYVLLQTGDSDGEPAGIGRIQSILDATLPVFQPR